MSEIRKLPAALTVAGSDSGGGAGVQADLRTFNAFGVYGCSAVTAVTSQNPDEVRRVDVLPFEAVTCQLETVLDAIPIRFAKTGMLANSGIIEAVAGVCKTRQLELVIDPVMVSTSGTRLLETSAVIAMKEKLFPLSTWITPNVPEAELICNIKINTLSDLMHAAKMLYEQFSCNVILKSGHLSSADHAVDAVCYEGKLYFLGSPHLDIPGNAAHGTGCTLSAALTALLACGKRWDEATVQAKAFVYGSLLERAALSGTLSQMYVPEKSYIDQIDLKIFE